MATVLHWREEIQPVPTAIPNYGLRGWLEHVLQSEALAVVHGGPGNTSMLMPDDAFVALGSQSNFRANALLNAWGSDLVKMNGSLAGLVLLVNADEFQVIEACGIQVDIAGPYAVVDAEEIAITLQRAAYWAERGQAVVLIKHGSEYPLPREFCMPSVIAEACDCERAGTSHPLLEWISSL